jgi:hypothetical protein
MCTAMRFEVQVKGFRWVGGVTGQEAYIHCPKESSISQRKYFEFRCLG